MTLPFDIEGPVKVEVFVVTLAGGRPILTGPCGAAPWLIETHGEGNPMDVAAGVVRSALDGVTVFHSTSWRWEAGSVVLTFVAVIPSAGAMEAAPVVRAHLARGGTSTAPEEIGHWQVLEHGLNHLRWLVEDDPVVSGALGGEWKTALSGYVPEPFRQLEEER